MLRRNVSIQKTYAPIEDLLRCMLVLPELDEAWGSIPPSTQEDILHHWAKYRVPSEQKFAKSEYASAGAWADLVVNDILQRSVIGPALTSLDVETRRELRGMFRGVIVAHTGTE